MKKNCFKCGESKKLSEFYKHSQMADGHVNKCKTCNKKDVANHRLINIDKIRAYDRERGSRQAKDYRDKYKNEFPIKYKARTIVSNSIRDGKLFREPCSICGREDTVHAHHDDYSKSLNIRWLCAAHHHQWHAKNGEGKNAR